MPLWLRPTFIFTPALASSFIKISPLIPISLSSFVPHKRRDAMAFVTFDYCLSYCATFVIGIPKLNYKIKKSKKLK